MNQLHSRAQKSPSRTQQSCCRPQHLNSPQHLEQPTAFEQQQAPQSPAPICRAFPASRLSSHLETAKDTPHSVRCSYGKPSFQSTKERRQGTGGRVPAASGME